MHALTSSQFSAVGGSVSIRRDRASAAATMTTAKNQAAAASAARLPLLVFRYNRHSLRCPPCAAGAPSQPGRKRGPGEEGSEAEALRAAAESSVDAPAKKSASTEGGESSSSSEAANGGSDNDGSAAAAPAAAAAREQQAAARAASAGADTPGGGLTPADLARLRAARAAEKEGAAPSSSSGGGGAGMGSGLFGDVLAEAKLIEWPSLKQALGDTVLVVGIVLGSALLLFVVNTLLADLSKVIY